MTNPTLPCSAQHEPSHKRGEGVMQVFFFSLATGDKDLHHMDGLGCFCVNILVEICI